MALRPKSGIHKIKAHMLRHEDGKYPPARVFLNSNESVFGPCQAAIDAASAASDNLFRYVEDAALQLSTALANRYSLDRNCIAVGNGSDDVLARLARIYLDSGTEMIRSRNGYLKTPNYAFANNATPISVADHEFTTSVDAILAAVNDKTRMVYVANPENPAGTYLAGSEVRRLHRGLPDNVLLVLDCAYEEYVDAVDYESGLVLAGEARNVVATRTFSKIFGLAGARLGWAFADAEIISMVNRIGSTFPLSSPSLAAGLAALADETHTDGVRATNKRLRDRFSERMRELGLKVYPSQTNFVLVQFDSHTRTAESCADFLRQIGIAVRRFASPAYADCIRVTIGLDTEMQEAESAIKTFLASPA